MQQDPNGTGQVVLDVAAMQGAVLLVSLEAPRAAAVFPDGRNGMCYLGSRPVGRADPMGLMFFSFADILGASGWQAERRKEHGNQLAEIRTTLRDQLHRIFDDAAYYQVDDALWASDWDREDDDYSLSSGPLENEGGPAASGGHAVPGVLHHIATNKNWKAGEKYSVKFKALFDRAGMSLNDKANLLEVSRDVHKGRHTNKYHEFILDRLSRAVGDKRGAEAARALRTELGSLKHWLKRNPTAYRKRFPWHAQKR